MEAPIVLYHRPFLLFYIVLLFLSGCHPILQGKPFPFDKRENGEEELIDSIEYHFKKGDLRRCETLLLRFLKEHKRSVYIGKALFYYGEICFYEKRYSEALKFYNACLKKKEQTRGLKIEEVQERLSFIYKELKDCEGLIRSFQDRLKMEKTGSGKALILEDLGDSYLKCDKKLDALISYSRSFHIRTTENMDLEEIIDKVRRLLPYIEEIHLPEIEKVFSLSFPVPYIIDELATRMIKSGDLSRARFFAERLMKEFKEPWNKRGEYLLKTIEMGRVEKDRVGLLVPLSKRFGTIGNAILDGINLAFEIKRREGWIIPEIVPRDTEGETEKIANLLEELAFEEKVLCVVGPLLQTTSEKAAIIAQLMDLPLITLTQREDVCRGRSFIFRNFVSMNEQVVFLARSLMTKKGFKNFAILIPDTSFGYSLASLFWDEVIKNGGYIRAAEIYDPSRIDLRDPVKNLVLSYYEEPRMVELSRRKREILNDGNPFNDKDKIILPPIIDFDAIFIPDNCKNSTLISHALAYAEVPVGRFLPYKGNIILVGLSSWNDKEFVERGGDLVEDAVFVDSFFLEDEKKETKEFVTAFMDKYGKEPDLFNAIGYDTGLILLEARGKDGLSAITREALRENLSKIGDLHGVTGISRFDQEGNMVRELILLTVKDGKIVKLKEDEHDEKIGGEMEEGVDER